MFFTCSLVFPFLLYTWYDNMIQQYIFLITLTFLLALWIYWPSVATTKYNISHNCWINLLWFVFFFLFILTVSSLRLSLVLVGRCSKARARAICSIITTDTKLAKRCFNRTSRSRITKLDLHLRPLALSVDLVFCVCVDSALRAKLKTVFNAIQHTIPRILHWVFFCFVVRFLASIFHFAMVVATLMRQSFHSDLLHFIDCL